MSLSPKRNSGKKGKKSSKRDYVIPTSHEAARYRPGGGDLLILHAPQPLKHVKSRLGTPNAKQAARYRPGGGDLKVLHAPLNLDVPSRTEHYHPGGHRPGGGNVRLIGVSPRRQGRRSTSVSPSRSRSRSQSASPRRFRSPPMSPSSPLRADRKYRGEVVGDLRDFGDDYSPYSPRQSGSRSRGRSPNRRVSPQRSPKRQTHRRSESQSSLPRSPRGVISPRMGGGRMKTVTSIRSPKKSVKKKKKKRPQSARKRREEQAVVVSGFELGIY